ncbi:MAG: DUF4886 domain-containing protein [Clostridia bacterium]|nr:DUF4886 domain-containing protein [Clostridia bacterium]MBQ8720303.1 DUF4886 domain-containing protein [Clostridia bacterium]
MNILAIGNSFSTDATRYLHSIARADGEKLEITNLYIGGCSLERHYRNMLSDKKEYELQYNGENTGFYVSLSEALLNRAWDVITFQQASAISFKPASYDPYIKELAAYVRKCSPKAKIYIHQTWAYEDGSDKLINAGYDSFENMLADVIKTYNLGKEMINADGTIPSGEMLGALLKAGVAPIHRDTFHASRGVGRYALGLIWYRTLLGKDVTNNAFRDFDELISEEVVAKIKACANSL